MKTPIASLPLSRRHLWIVFVASLGQLIGTAVATIAGVVIPMINILRHPELSSVVQGVIGAADLVGIMIGSVILGRLSDRYGYLLFFRLCPAIMLVASLVAIFIPSVTVLIVALFFIGLGIGGEYSLDSDYISELLPVKYRALMVGVAKSVSALGNIIAALLCFVFILEWKDASRWPDLMWIVAAIAALMIVLRIKFYESPTWLAAHGKVAAAEKAIQEFLGPDAELDIPSDSATVSTPTSPTAQTSPKSAASSSSLQDSSGVSDAGESAKKGSFFRTNFSRIVLSGVPWACEGLGVYGIGVFLPILVMALGLEHGELGVSPILHVAQSVKITFYISCIILPGFLIGLLMIRRKAYLPTLQSVGFWVCAASLIVLLLAFHYGWNKWISIGSFMLFELFLNIGPHLVTYVLPPKIYPVADRGQGVGIAAGIGKLGAVLGVFFIPVLLHWGGPVLVLIVSAAVMALGAIVTSAFGPKVMSRS